jgi:predicted dithiol-disulfide oxidoreductase (DUF899 family)
MWRWDLGQGCPSCSFFADHVDGANVHLANHDVTFVAISRGRLADLEAYRKRLGWRFKLISSYGSDFNYDYHVSFTKEELAKGKINYNYETIEDAKYQIDELPGFSVFYKDENGDVFQTYSSYARGGDLMLGAYKFIDLTPKGRNEERNHGLGEAQRRVRIRRRRAILLSPGSADERGISRRFRMY